MNEKIIKILLVEDNPNDALLIKKNLLKDNLELKTKNRFEVEHVKKRIEALKLLEEKKFDLILSDLGLPDSSDLDTLESLHDKAPKTPVVVLTGLDDEDIAIKAVHGGAQDYLLKNNINHELLVHSILYAIERQRLLQEMEAMREEFLSTLTHDLKSPLVAMLGYVDLTTSPQCEEASDQKEEYMQLIKQSGKLLLNMINNIVEACKIDAGRLQLKLENFSIDDILKETHRTYESLAILNNITLEFPSAEDIWVNADYNKIRNVLHNLLSNSLKFTPSGGKITLSIIPKDKEIEVSISDTGCGIPVSEQDKVFEKYSQGNTEEYGTGLGLYIVKNFLQAHGSSVRLESEPGKSTKICFNLPKGNKPE
ncbi:MAG: hybrid sensor histidine kinase/response regulator [Armatimonadota bacterium]